MNTAINDSPPITQPAPSTLRAPPRVDVFGPIHKAIRRALADLLGQIGATDFADPAAVARVTAQLGQVVDLCEDHRSHEERIMLPALGERLQGTLDSIHSAHGVQPVMVAELRALAEAVANAAEHAKHVAGRTLYLHFTTFTAELLLHMAAEEQVVQPLIERFFSDEELREIHGRIMASMTMAEKMRSAPFLIRALSPPERAAFVTGVMASSPREAADALLDLARSVLTQTEFADLASRISQ